MRFEELKEQLAEHRENCCCLENEKLRLDKAKLEEENKQLRKLLRECKGNILLCMEMTSVGYEDDEKLLKQINVILGESEEQ